METTPAAPTPTAAGPRSRAMDRRLRKRRQEARLRLRLAADADLLAAHHASRPPFACQPSAASADQVSAVRVGQLEAQVAELKEQILLLRESVALLQPQVPAAASESMKLEEELGGAEQGVKEEGEVKETSKVVVEEQDLVEPTPTASQLAAECPRLPEERGHHYKEGKGTSRSFAEKVLCSISESDPAARSGPRKEEAGKQPERRDKTPAVKEGALSRSQAGGRMRCDERK